jgi:hypothetical protein
MDPGKNQGKNTHNPLPQSNTEAFFFFHSRTVHLDIIKVVYLPTDAQYSCFKKNIKIYIKTAPTCFGAITIIREHIFELAKITRVKIIN